jgi:hypothetical protein
MNHIKKTLTITTTREYFAMKMRPTVTAFCDRCRTDVPWLYLNDAAVFGRIPVRKIFGLIESGEIHSRETSDCQVLVCHESLTQNLSQKEN